jgi:single-strand DNA-binding protein
MSKGVNKVILVGHVGKDPVVRYTPAGMAVANVSIATGESWKDKQTGEKQEHTEWHRLVFFDKLAQVVGEWVKKGTLLYVEGSLKTTKYVDKDKIERYSTDVKVAAMQMLGSKGADNAAPREAAQATQNDAPMDDDTDFDIPF